MKTLTLTRGETTLICACHYDKVKPFTWYLARGYVQRTHKYPDGKWRTININRFIMDTPQGMDTDHINGNPLDNRCTNLRIISRSGNKANAQKYKTNTSGYKGVTKHTLKYGSIRWKACIGSYTTGNWQYLGLYETKEEAAEAYNQAALALYGDTVLLNDCY